MVSDFETAEPPICSLINIVIPALCLRSTLKSCPPFLPRIPGGRNDTSRRWHGCHSSTVPLPDKLADTAGLPPSPWESVSKFHCHLWVDMPRVPCWAWRLRRSLGWLLERHLSWRRSSHTSAQVFVLVPLSVQFSRFRKVSENSLHPFPHLNAKL